MVIPHLDSAFLLQLTDPFGSPYHSQVMGKIPERLVIQEFERQAKLGLLYQDSTAVDEEVDSSIQCIGTPISFDSILITSPPIIDPWGGWQPWPPPYIPIVEPWLPINISMFVWTPMNRSRGAAERIYSMVQADGFDIEVQQVDQNFNIKMHAQKDQVISFNLREINDHASAKMAYQNISIPIHFKEGYYEFNGRSPITEQTTYLLEVLTNGTKGVCRIESHENAAFAHSSTRDINAPEIAFWEGILWN